MNFDQLTFQPFAPASKRQMEYKRSKCLKVQIRRFQYLIKDLGILSGIKTRLGEEDQRPFWLKDQK